MTVLLAGTSGTGKSTLAGGRRLPSVLPVLPVQAASRAVVLAVLNIP